MSAYTSIKAVAKGLVPFFGNLVSDRFRNIDVITNVICPILFIHGKKDTLISF